MYLGYSTRVWPPYLQNLDEFEILPSGYVTTSCGKKKKKPLFPEVNHQIIQISSRFLSITSQFANCYGRVSPTTHPIFQVQSYPLRRKLCACRAPPTRTAKTLHSCLAHLSDRGIVGIHHQQCELVGPGEPTAMSGIPKFVRRLSPTMEGDDRKSPSKARGAAELVKV